MKARARIVQGGPSWNVVVIATHDGGSEWIIGKPQKREEKMLIYNYSDS
jgi:hypothetical protein